MAVVMLTLTLTNLDIYCLNVGDLHLVRYNEPKSNENLLIESHMRLSICCL